MGIGRDLLNKRTIHEQLRVAGLAHSPAAASGSYLVTVEPTWLCSPPGACHMWPSRGLPGLPGAAVRLSQTPSSLSARHKARAKTASCSLLGTGSLGGWGWGPLAGSSGPQVLDLLSASLAVDLPRVTCHRSQEARYQGLLF